MQTCLVGGAVIDALLGLPVQERDWVVVGATPEQRVAQGFLPVGKDFPVTCTPVTRKTMHWPTPCAKPRAATRGL